jgi:hypothetical protein
VAGKCTTDIGKILQSLSVVDGPDKMMCLGLGPLLIFVVLDHSVYFVNSLLMVDI